MRLWRGIQENRNKTYMSLSFVTSSGEPLSEATVSVSDDDGDVVFRGQTDVNGHIHREGMYLDNYLVFAEWMGTEVWSGSVDHRKERDETIECMVYRFSVDFVDMFGNKIPGGDVRLGRRITTLQKDIILDLETDESGSISILLLYGFYEVSCSYGMYAGSSVVNLNRDYSVTVTCSVSSLLWISMLAVIVPLIAFTLLLERRRLRTPLEIRKYRDRSIWNLCIGMV